MCAVSALSAVISNPFIEYVNVYSDNSYVWIENDRKYRSENTFLPFKG